MGPATKLMTKAAWHARTAPEVVEKSNRKLERWHYSVNGEAIHPACPTSQEQARHLVAEYMQHESCVRLHNALSYIAPMDFLNGLAPQIWAERNRRLEQARSQRAKRHLSIALCQGEVRSSPTGPQP